MKNWLAKLAIVAVLAAAPRLGAADKPNIIFILADDLGYAELGSYGQKIIQTPNLDKMAREGMRFTRFYAGSTVCAPSRSVLMTGKHSGRTTVRGNAGAQGNSPQMLRAEDFTVAEMLKQAGYATALIGKWGLGMPGDEGQPTRQGFDYFYGYLSQHHAHNHFPDFLWRNAEKVPLPNQIVPVGTDGAGYATNAARFAGDLLAEEALAFVERAKAGPFFLYLSLVAPHANNERKSALGNGAEVPDYGPYQNEPWSEPLKGHAAMITRMDADVGRLLEKLRSTGLATNTIVFFSSDNGPHKESGHDPAFFDPNGPLRGYKRDLYEGGIRVPLIAWWPERVQPGVSEHTGSFADFMATCADLSGAQLPGGLDSFSLASVFLGRGWVTEHNYLYWEFHEAGFSQAVLLEGRWKGIRLKRMDAPIEVYDLRKDPGEERDLALDEPGVVRRVEQLFRSARQESPIWPIREAAREMPEDAPKGRKRG